MVKGIKWKKGITVMAVFSMVVSMVPSGPLVVVKAEEKQEASNKSSSNISAEALNVDVDFYDYNITTYKGKTAKNKIALNDYAIDTLTASGSSVTEKDIFLFGGDRKRSETGAHNVWTGKDGGTYQGIVSKELAKDGSLQFNNEKGIYGVDIFPDEGDTRLEGIVDGYYNTNFQFLDDDGTYIFDSDQFSATGLRKNTGKTGCAIDIDFTKRGPHFKNGVGSKKNEYGFFPFNTITGENNNTNEKRHHMFGMKMELDFYMPEDGKIGTKSNPDAKNPMVFSFSGDDDVWVYIDGKLALDLGGIHDVVNGSINFATGEVKSTANASKISHKITNIYKDCGIEDGAYSMHTLTMFYLERGEYDSNCKITFNLPSLVKTDDIAITKKAEGVPEDKTEDYQFQLLYGESKKLVEDEESAEVYNGKYTVYDASNKEIGTEQTKNGIISLAAGETAVVSKKIVIDNVQEKDKKIYYKVKELMDDPHYETEWGATGLTADEGSATYGDGTETIPLTASSEEGQGNTIIFTNKYRKWTQFTLEKELEKGMENSDKFEFLVKIGEKEERVVLQAGEKKTWEKIPTGTTYEIKEVVTGGSIYTTPDVTVDELEQKVVIEKNAVTQVSQDVFVVSGSVLQAKAEGAETKVVYTNKVEEEPIVTPSPSTQPTETPTSGKPSPSINPTKTPTSDKPSPSINPTKTPTLDEPSPSINPTETPTLDEPSPSINPTKTPTSEPTIIPSVTPIVTGEPTETPDVTPTVIEKPTVTPSVTEEPTETPSTTPVATEESTATPTSTSVILEEPTQLPLSPIGPAGEEVEETETPEPTMVPTAAPIPTPKPTKVPVQLDDTEDLPNAPIENELDKEDDSYNEDEEHEDASEEDVEIISDDDIPNKLPQTGGLGSIFVQKNKGIYAGIVFIFVSGIAIGSCLIRRKRTK